MHTTVIEGIQRNCMKFSIYILLDILDILMSSYLDGFALVAGHKLAYMRWGESSEWLISTGSWWSVQELLLCALFANTWDWVDQTSHISSLQNVQDLSDIFFPGWGAFDLSSISGSLKNFWPAFHELLQLFLVSNIWHLSTSGIIFKAVTFMSE